MFAEAEAVPCGRQGDDLFRHLTKNGKKYLSENKKYLVLLIFLKSYAFLKMGSEEKSPASSNIHSVDMGALFCLLFANC